MSIIDVNAEGLPKGDNLQPARNRRHGVQRPLQRHHRDFERDACAHRRQRIVNIMTSDQRETAGETAFEGLDHKP